MGKNKRKTKPEFDSTNFNTLEDHQDEQQCVSTDNLGIEQLISKQATSALLYLLFYSILMFTLPFGAFFGARHLLREYTDFAEFTITSLSVTSSVITMYIIIGLYAYKGYIEKEIIIPEEPLSKKTK